MVEVIVERRAPLNEIYKIGSFGDKVEGAPGVVFAERRALSIVQVAAWQDQADSVVAIIEKIVKVKPSRLPCVAQSNAETSAIWLGPDRWIIVESENRDLPAIIRDSVTIDLAAVTDQSHSRCVIRLRGEQVRNVLRKGTSLDLDETHFSPDQVCSTSLFHMNAIIHCLTEDIFDIYVARSFGQSFFEVITHAASEYGYEVDYAL